MSFVHGQRAMTDAQRSRIEQWWQSLADKQRDEVLQVPPLDHLPDWIVQSLNKASAAHGAYSTYSFRSASALMTPDFRDFLDSKRNTAD